jgi:hypothetical protein
MSTAAAQMEISLELETASRRASLYSIPPMPTTITGNVRSF